MQKYTSHNYKTLPTDQLEIKLTIGNTEDKNLILISKLLASLKAQYKPVNYPTIYNSHQSRQFYCYLHISISETEEKLQEKSAFP